MTDPNLTAPEAVPLDEQYDTMMEVERDPFGAWHAIQALAARVAELSARSPIDPASLDTPHWKARAEKAEAQLAARDGENAKLREALTEAVEVVHKAYVAATMEAVNAGPSHPLKDNFDKWRVRCMNAETTARAALQGETT